MEYHRPEHPQYVRDYDDDLDSTHAYVVFKVPDEFKQRTAGMATGEGPQTIKEKFDATVAELKKMRPEQLRKDPRMKPIIEVLDKIVKQSDNCSGGENFPFIPGKEAGRAAPRTLVIR